MTRERRYFVNEVCEDSCKHLRCFIFEIGGYRCSVSFNSFFFGKKIHNRNGAKVYCPTHVSEIIQFGGSFERHKLDKINNGTAIVCKDVFDFYKKIGYDYKSKKYL